MLSGKEVGHSVLSAVYLFHLHSSGLSSGLRLIDAVKLPENVPSSHFR